MQVAAPLSSISNRGDSLSGWAALTASWFSLYKGSARTPLLLQERQVLYGWKDKVPSLGDTVHLAALNPWTEHTTYAAGQPARSCNHKETPNWDERNHLSAGMGLLWVVGLFSLFPFFFSFSWKQFNFAARSHSYSFSLCQKPVHILYNCI